jgi:MarR family transcriptional regulator for hemolysin
LEKSIGYKIYKTSKAFHKSFDLELRDKVGITLSQCKVINVLISFNGITQKEIADKLELEAPSIIPLIDKMEELKLLERRSDPNDRRLNRIYLTKKASALIDPMYECSIALLRMSTKGLSQEKLDLIQDGLEKIIQNLVSNYKLDNF